MGEVSRTLEQMNAAQQRAIIEMSGRIKEMELWERFAAHLLNNCEGQIVTPENLELWLSQLTKGKS